MREMVKVYKCPYCGAIQSRDGELFYVERGNPELAKMRVRLHIIMAHPDKSPDVEPEIVEIKESSKRGV